METDKKYFIKIYFNGGGRIVYSGLTAAQRKSYFEDWAIGGFALDPLKSCQLNNTYLQDTCDIINFDQVIMIEVGLMENRPRNERYGRTHNLDYSYCVKIEENNAGRGGVMPA